MINDVKCKDDDFELVSETVNEELLTEIQTEPSDIMDIMMGRCPKVQP